MATRTSKTARASVRAGRSSGALTVLGQFRYLIPLDRGRHAYVRNPLTGTTSRRDTGCAAFVDELRALAQAGHGTKIRSELGALAAANPTHGWDQTERRLADAGVFDS